MVQKENSETVVCLKGYSIVPKYVLNKKNEKIILVPVGLFGKTGKTLAKDLIQWRWVKMIPSKARGGCFLDHASLNNKYRNSAIIMREEIVSTAIHSISFTYCWY